jgi:hypothetical protein
VISKSEMKPCQYFLKITLKSNGSSIHINENQIPDYRIVKEFSNNALSLLNNVIEK